MYILNIFLFRCTHSDCKLNDKCLMFVIQEYDYVSSPSFQGLWELKEPPECSVILSLSSCKGVEDKKINMLNVSIHFARPNNVHVSNISKICFVSLIFSPRFFL